MVHIQALVVEWLLFFDVTVFRQWFWLLFFDVTVFRQWFTIFLWQWWNGDVGTAHLGDVGPPLNFTDCNVGHPSERCIDFCVEFHRLQRRHSSGRCIDLCDTPDAVCAMVEQLQFMTMVNGFCDNGVLQNLYDVDPPIGLRRLQRRASVRTMY